MAELERDSGGRMDEAWHLDTRSGRGGSSADNAQSPAQHGSLNLGLQKQQGVEG